MNSIFKRILLVQSLIIPIANATLLEPWESTSRPEIASKNFEYNVSRLPLNGSIQDGVIGWSGDYWPAKLGHINIRWNSPEKLGFDYVSPTGPELRRMSFEDISKLSPSEKFDLLNGNYHYPLKQEVSKKANPRAKDWNGICHGWSQASLNHAEPTPKTLRNPDGILIPFGSSDIKALLSYYYAYRHKAEDRYQVGKRCKVSRLVGALNKYCKEDLNAGAFHLITANMLGIRKTGFIVDIDRYKEVWNQPVVEFASRIVRNNLTPDISAAKGTIKEIEVETYFYYVEESENNTWDIVRGTPEQKITSKVFQYILEIDGSNKIVGGRWLSEERPDFIWSKTKTNVYSKDFARLPDLLND